MLNSDIAQAGSIDKELASSSWVSSQMLLSGKVTSLVGGRRYMYVVGSLRYPFAVWCIIEQSFFFFLRFDPRRKG